MVRFSSGGGWNLRTTNDIKAICSILVMCSHIFPCFSWAGYISVGVFFMFTGYGLVYSWKAKADYLNGFLRKRVVRVLWPYITANCFAILICAIFDNGVIFRDALISFVSLRYLSSAWYVFAIILFYIAFYIIGKRAHNEKNLAILLIIFWGVYFLVCVVTHQKTFWYNSSFCFVLGVVGAIQKQYSLKVNSKGKLFAYSVILVLTVAMIAFSPRKLILDLAFSTLFSALIAVFVFTFEIKNEVLDKLGGIRCSLEQNRQKNDHLDQGKVLP